MRAWKLVTPRLIEVLEVDDDTGEVGKITQLTFESHMTKDEARSWMTNHYPVVRDSSLRGRSTSSTTP